MEPVLGEETRFPYNQENSLLLRAGNMGKPDRVLKLEDRQEELLAKGDQKSMKKYWQLQKRQERLARKDQAARETLDDVDQHTQVMDELAGLEGDIRLDNESARINLQLETLRTRINDITKQLHRLQRQKDGTHREATLKAAEAKLNYLENEYLDTNRKYNRKLKKGKFLEDMRTVEQIQGMVKQIEDSINAAKKLGGEALTDTENRQQNKKNRSPEQTTAKSSPYERTKSFASREEARGDSLSTGLRYEINQLANSDILDPTGQRLVRGGGNLLDMGIKGFLAIGGLRKAGSGLFNLIFGGKEKRQEAGKTFGIGLAMLGGYVAYNHVKWGKAREKVTGEDIENNEGMNSPTAPEHLKENYYYPANINTAIGIIPFGLLEGFLRYNDKKVVGAKRSELKTQIEGNNIEGINQDKKKLMLAQINKFITDNNGDEQITVAFDKVGLDKTTIETNKNNPNKNVYTAYYQPYVEKVKQEEIELDEKSKQNNSRPSIEEEIPTIEEKDDIYGYKAKLEQLTTVDKKRQLQALQVLVTLKKRYKSSGLDIKPISDKEIELTTDRGIVQKIDLQSLTIEGFDDTEKNLGVISFGSVQELLMSSWQTIVLTQLAKKLLKDKTEIKRPFETGRKIWGSKIDITTNEKTLLEQLRSNVTGPFDWTNIAAGGIGGLISGLAKKSVSWGIKGGVISTIGREFGQAVYDTRDTTAASKKEIEKYPTINQNLESYVNYLNNLYQKTTG